MGQGVPGGVRVLSACQDSPCGSGCSPCVRVRPRALTCPGVCGSGGPAGAVTPQFIPTGNLGVPAPSPNGMGCRVMPQSPGWRCRSRGRPPAQPGHGAAPRLAVGSRFSSAGGCPGYSGKGRRWRGGVSCWWPGRAGSPRPPCRPRRSPVPQRGDARQPQHRSARGSGSAPRMTQLRCRSQGRGEDGESPGGDPCPHPGAARPPNGRGMGFGCRRCRERSVRTSPSRGRRQRGGLGSSCCGGG